MGHSCHLCGEKNPCFCWAFSVPNLTEWQQRGFPREPSDPLYLCHGQETLLRICSSGFTWNHEADLSNERKVRVGFFSFVQHLVFWDPSAWNEISPTLLGEQTHTATKLTLSWKGWFQKISCALLTMREFSSGIDSFFFLFFRVCVCVCVCVCVWVPRGKCDFCIVSQQGRDIYAQLLRRVLQTRQDEEDNPCRPSFQGEVSQVTVRNSFRSSLPVHKHVRSIHCCLWQTANCSVKKGNLNATTGVALE